MSSLELKASATLNKDNFFCGFDLLMKTIEKDLKTHSDVLVVLAHFLLIKHFNMGCLGIGEDKTLESNEETGGSEILPDEWNANSEKYSLRYILNKKLYLLICYKSSDYMILHLWPCIANKVSSLVLSPEKEVKNLSGGKTITDFMPNARSLSESMCSRLIHPVLANVKKDGDESCFAQRNSVDIYPLDPYRHTYIFDYYDHPAARSISQIPLVNPDEYSSVSPLSSRDSSNPIQSTESNQ